MKFDIYKIGDELYAVSPVYGIKVLLIHLTGDEPKTIYAFTFLDISVDIMNRWGGLRNTAIYVYNKVVLNKSFWPSHIDNAMLIVEKKELNYYNNRTFVCKLHGGEDDFVREIV